LKFSQGSLCGLLLHPGNSASLHSGAISPHLVAVVCCSESGSVVWHAEAFSDAGTELWIDLEEVLELSLFGGAVDGAHVTRNVVHKTLSLALVEHFVEENAWLLIHSVRVSVCVSADWAVCVLGVDGVLLVFSGSLVLRWLVVRGLAETVQVHDSVALIIGGTQSGSVWAVDWNLVVVGAEAMSVGVGVVDESALEHLAVGSFDAWDEVSWREGGLLGLGMEVLWVLVESESTDLDQRAVGLAPCFGDVIYVVLVFLTFFEGHGLHVHGP